MIIHQVVLQIFKIETLLYSVSPDDTAPRVKVPEWRIMLTGHGFKSALQSVIEVEGVSVDLSSY